jgi:hypothetical protein
MTMNVKDAIKPQIVSTEHDLIITIETFTWQECKRLVAECNTRNRRMNNTGVERLMHDVAANRYYVTHQGVAFDAEGIIIDGQHRFEAHARAEIDFTTVVCRYTSQEAALVAMAIFDSGSGRSAADSNAIGGVMPKDLSASLTAVCSFLHSLIHGIDTSMSRLRLADFYRQWKEPVDWSVTTLSEKRFTSTIRACFALAYLANKARTVEFAEQLKAGVAAPDSAAALWNRAQGDGSFSTAGGYGARRDSAFRALRIIKGHIAGERMPGRLFAEESSLLWFRDRLPKAPAPIVVKAQEPPTALDERILALLANGGEWRALNIKAALQSAQSTTQDTLRALVTAGKIVRVGYGVYRLPAAAKRAA